MHAAARVSITPIPPPPPSSLSRRALSSRAPVDILVRSPLGRSTWVPGQIIRKAGTTVDVEYDDESRGLVMATLQNDSPLLARAGQYTSRSAAASPSSRRPRAPAPAPASSAASVEAALTPAAAPARQRTQDSTDSVRLFYEQKMKQVVERLSEDLQREAQAKMEAILQSDIAEERIQSLEKQLADLQIEHAQERHSMGRKASQQAASELAAHRTQSAAESVGALDVQRAEMAAAHAEQIVAIRAEHDAELARALAAQAEQHAAAQKQDVSAALTDASDAHDGAMNAMQMSLQSELLRIVKQASVAASAAEVARKNAVDAIARLARAPGEWADRVEDKALLSRQRGNVAVERFEELRAQGAAEGEVATDTFLGVAFARRAAELRTERNGSESVKGNQKVS